MVRVQQFCPVLLLPRAAQAATHEVEAVLNHTLISLWPPMLPTLLHLYLPPLGHRAS